MHSLAWIFIFYIFYAHYKLSFIHAKNKKGVIINSLRLLKSLCGIFVLNAELYSMKSIHA